MKSKALLNIIISLIVGFIIGGYLYSVVSSANSSTEFANDFSERSFSGKHYGRTQDGVLCDVSYSWYVNHNISEDQQLKIDLLLKRTIAKSFSYYEYKQIINIPDDFTVDFKSRLEDAVFAIEPGFVITNVFIIKNSLK